MGVGVRTVFVSAFLVGLVGLFAFGEGGQTGTLSIDVTSILGHGLPSKVELISKEGLEPIVIRVPAGELETSCPPGRYEAHVYVYDWDIPLLVDIVSVEITPDKETFVLVNLAEGSGLNRALREFDRDNDLVLDRVELNAGTDPDDPASFPGARPVSLKSNVIAKEPGWYRGDLHVRSAYGGGAESVPELVRRAEKEGLDFLAITDRNTMAACEDPAFRSDKVVLIPAMEWGEESQGVALIYGPRTLPEKAEIYPDAQGVAYRVQAQGGIFAVAHPCFPNAPWQQGVSNVNAVEVWCRDWRGVPPITLDALSKDIRLRTRDGKLVFSIARAAVASNLSANGQAGVFLDEELARGLKASPIAGSLSSSSKVRMGRPITYVYAEEKSLAGILEGLRRGRTCVSSGPDGPKIRFQADVLANGLIDADIGEIVPTGVLIEFFVTVTNARGLKAQVYQNGLPILTKVIEKDHMLVRFRHKANSYSVYRVQVAAIPPANVSREKWAAGGFGELDVRAMSGPIYAQDMLVVAEGMDPTDLWIKLKNENTPPVYAQPFRTPEGQPVVRVDKDLPAPTEGEFQPPPGEPVRTIKPQFRF